MQTDAEGALNDIPSQEESHLCNVFKVWALPGAGQ